MLKLSVPEMSCGHCISAVESAVREVDASARVTTELETKLVIIESSAADEHIRAAIKAAGYENQPAQA
jgi:copper chaperone